jgi:hypothetical protein
MDIENMLHESIMEAVVAMSKANVFRKVLRDRIEEGDVGSSHFQRPDGGWNSREPGILTDMVFDRVMKTLDDQMKASFEIVVNKGVKDDQR